MQHTTLYTTPTVRDYVRVLFRYKWVIVVTCVTVIATVSIGLKMKTPQYEASVKMLISAEKQVETPFYRDIMTSRNAEITLTQSEIVKSDPVLSRVVRALGLYARPLNYEKNFSSGVKRLYIAWRTWSLEKKLSQFGDQERTQILFRYASDSLREAIEVEPIRDTNLFTINVKDFSNVGAAVIANAVSRSYVMFDLEQQLVELEMKYGDKHPAVKQMKDSLKRMEETLSGKPLPNVEALGPASVKIVEQAQPPLKPSGTPEILTFILAVVMGPFLGVMLAFMFEYMDQTIKLPIDIERVLAIPFLGSIPKKGLLVSSSLITHMDSNNAFVRAHHTLTDQIYMLIKDKSLRSLAVTAVLPEEGVSTLTANIGVCLAHKMKKDVVIVDTNMRYPSLTKKCKVAVKNPNGLAEVIAGKVKLSEVIHEAGPHVYCIPAGKCELNPITVLDSEGMKSVVAELKSRFSLVLFDAPNMRNYQDPYLIGSFVDGVVVVLQEGVVRRQVVQQALEPLKNENVPVLGGILNFRTYPIPKFLYNVV